MSSPDISSYVDLTLYDSDPSTLVNRMVLNAQQLLPDWKPAEALTEMAVAESLALVIAELVYAANRLPSATVQTLLQLFGITRGAGTAATATVTVNIAGTSGATIPAGTLLEVQYGSQAYVFSTTAALTIPSGSSAGTATVACATATAAVNGIPAGTSLTVLSPQLAAVNTVVFAAAPAGGADPETVSAWLNRGISRLQGITTALVTADQFKAAALNVTVAADGNLIYDADFARVLSGTGSWKLGGGGTYGTANGDWQVPAAGLWEYLGTGAAAGYQHAESQIINVTPGVTYTLAVTIDATNVTAGQPVCAVYDPTVATEYVGVSAPAGRPATAMTVPWTCPAGVTQVRVVIDTNNVTVTAGQPVKWSAVSLLAVGGTITAATRATVIDNWDPTLSGGAGGGAEGSVTVAVMGPGGVFLTDAQKTALQSALAASAVAGLAIHVVDPTVDPVNVTCTVWQQPGYSAAQVRANVLANLTAATTTGGAGISTDTWEWGATLRLFDLVTAIRTAPGVAYVPSVATPTADMSLGGTAPLAALGTVTITVEGP